MNNNENNRIFLLNSKQNKLEAEEDLMPIHLKPKNEDNIPYNLSNQNWRKNLLIQNSFSTNRKDRKIKIQKIKTDIENNIQRRNIINFNKTSYPLSKNNQIFHCKDEEPFFLNDKYISNSFIINNDDKIKKYKNNGYIENPSKLLSKDEPSSLNNTGRYLNSRLSKDENNKNNYSSNNYYIKDFITFKNKDFILFKDNNKIIKAEKMNNFDFDIDFNGYQLNNINFNNLSSLNSMNSEKYKNLNLGENNQILSTETEDTKLKLNIPKLKTKIYLKNILFHKNQINEYRYKNNKKLVYEKNSFSTKNWKNLDNKFLNNSMQPCEIESCIISFRNLKSNFKEKENNIKNLPDYAFNKIKYEKKNINKYKKNKLSLKRKLNINVETENANTNDYTSYLLYKKPNLSISQNIKRDYPKNNNIEDNNLAYSHLTVYNKTENNDKEDIFYKRQYLGDIFMKYKNKRNSKINNKCNIVFRKKQINYLYHNNFSTLNISPIYKKKCPSILRKFNKNKLLDNLLDNNISSNSHSFVNKNNHIYIKANNSKINSAYKFFNSQIINIKNNIFHLYDNNISSKNEYINTTFVEEKQMLNNKNKVLKSKIINKYSFDKKYYNYYIYIPKKKLKRNIASEKKIKNEILMKKSFITFSYYTKSKVKFFTIPKICQNFITKIYIIKKIKSHKIKDNKNVIKKKLIAKTNQNKERNIIKRNYEDKLEYKSKTIKEEKSSISEINKEFKKIKVVRKNLNSKVKVKVKNNNNDKNINNIKKVRLNENEILKLNNNQETQSMIRNNKSEIINYPQIPLSPKILKKLEEIYNSNINNYYIKNEEKKESKKPSIKLKSNSLLRKRSSSIKDKRNIKINERNDTLKIKLPNSEARKKKYKINIVKRLKVKYKKNLNNFSEEKILINNCNNDINEDQNIMKRNKRIQKSKKEIERKKKIILIIKEDLENYILFTKNNMDNINLLIKNYNYSIIGQLLMKEKIDLSNLIIFYLEISFNIIDTKNKIYICNDYINNIIEKYKRTYLNKNNFIQTHEDILEILIDIIAGGFNKNQNKYKFDIVGALFYSLLINELFFVSDLNMFINCEEQIHINIAKIIRYIIIYSNNDKFKSQYFEVFKNSKLFFNNPIYFKYVTKYLKLLNANCLVKLNIIKET